MEKKPEMPKLKFSKEELQKTGIFLLSTVLIYSILLFSTALVPVEKFEFETAKATMAVLGIFGMHGDIYYQEPVLIVLSQGTKIEISALCTGLMELIVIISAILASHGISWKKRAIGVLSAIIIAPIFNLLRIIITILLILNSNSIELIDLTHGILFRITLFLIIMGIYTIWFLWAIGQLKIGKKAAK